MADDNDDKRRIFELEDQLKQRDRRIDELRREIDEQRDLIRRVEETRWEGSHRVWIESPAGQAYLRRSANRSAG